MIVYKLILVIQLFIFFTGFLGAGDFILQLLPSLNFLYKQKPLLDIRVESSKSNFLQIELVHLLLASSWRRIALLLIFKLFVEILDDSEIVLIWFTFFISHLFSCVILSRTALVWIMNWSSRLLTQLLVLNFQFFIFFVFSSELSFQICDFCIFCFDFFLML